MAVKDGLPSTDFSRQNREYIKELIEESGGGGESILIIHMQPIPDDPDDNMILDKTWKEIADAVTAGTPAYIFLNTSEDGNTFIYCTLVTQISHTGLYNVTDTNNTSFVASTENDYPKTMS